MSFPAPDLFVDVGGGRRIALDDRGDPRGTPVLYLHGTPDSRLSRHPDDAIARHAGVRLLCPDRPGVGASDVDAAATPRSVADDLVAVLDALGIDAASVLAWSAGAITALALAGSRPHRVRSLTLIAPLVPADAYDDPAALAGADDSRALFASMLGELPADELGRELAAWLVPPEIDDATARAMLETSLATVDAATGAQLVLGLRAAVTGDLTGVEREIAAQATPLGPLLDSVIAPAEIHVGSADTVAPVAMARWIAGRLGVSPTEHAGAGHALAMTDWARFLAAAVRGSG